MPPAPWSPSALTPALTLRGGSSGPTGAGLPPPSGLILTLPAATQRRWGPPRDVPGSPLPSSPGDSCPHDTCPCRPVTRRLTPHGRPHLSSGALAWRAGPHPFSFLCGQGVSLDERVFFFF